MTAPGSDKTERRDMRMVYFTCDYQEGCHPAILEALEKTNFEQTPGYGEDKYCREAADMIRGLCAAPDAAVHFLVGGTQVNLLAVSCALRPHQGAICAAMGHINTHESGAIEATGHKCLALPSPDGKLTGDQVRAYVRAHFADATHEHMVQPGMVYASVATELGANYTRVELEDLWAACRETGIYLYIDGARLACALADAACDWDLPFLCAHTDAFTMGGTKAGLLFGEALVIRNPALQKDFRYFIKQRGGLLAKGRLLGIQYGVMLRDGLYFRLGQHAVAMAEKIRRALAEMNVPLLSENGTNQTFPILPDRVLEAISDRFTLCPWERVDETRQAVRIATSWATREEDVDALIAALKAAMQAEN